MTAARILERVQFGYGKAGSKLGLTHTLFRPSDAGPVFDPKNIMRTLPFTASATPDGGFGKPSKYGSPIQYALVDVRGTGPMAIQPGDYVQGPTGTWFFASCDHLVIPMVVQCNAVVNVVRAPGNTAPGVQPYGGRTTATDVALMTGWPASVIAGGRQEAGRADLPGDVSMKGYIVLLPAWLGVMIRTSDRVVDERGQVMTVAQAELTALGWRLQATMSEV